MYSTVYSILYIKMYSTVYTVTYTILYTDAISGIDKYTVYLTEHSFVNLPKYPLALQGLFLLLTRGAENSRPNYTALSCPTEQLSWTKKNKFSLGPTKMDFPAISFLVGVGLVSPLLGQSPYPHPHRHYHQLTSLPDWPAAPLTSPWGPPYGVTWKATKKTACKRSNIQVN